MNHKLHEPDQTPKFIILNCPLELSIKYIVEDDNKLGNLLMWRFHLMNQLLVIADFSTPAVRTSSLPSSPLSLPPSLLPPLPPSLPPFIPTPSLPLLLCPTHTAAHLVSTALRTVEGVRSLPSVSPTS